MNASFFVADLFAPKSEPDSDDKGANVTLLVQRQESPIQVNAGSHFNTTGLQGDDLKAAKRRNGQQNAVILALLRASETPLTPREVMHRCHASGHAFLIGSVRRAITTLTQDGALVKLNTKRRGDAGAFEFEWRAA